MPKFLSEPVSPEDVQVWSLYGGRVAVRVPWRLIVEPMFSDADPLECRVALTLDVESGQLVCTGVCAERLPGGPPVTAEMLRRIPVSRLTAETSTRGNLVAEIDSESGVFVWPPEGFTADGPTDVALEQIARIYAYCMATARVPGAELKQRYGMNSANVSRWIATARRRGILVDEHRKLD